MSRYPAIGLIVLFSFGIFVGWIFRNLPEANVTAYQLPPIDLQADQAMADLPATGQALVAGKYSFEEQQNIAVYDNCNRGVVNISTKSLVNNFLSVTVGEGSGSGSVIDKEGLILTNFHVVEDAREIVVTLFNNESFPAKVVGLDPDNDIAVLRIKAPSGSLFPIPWGDNTQLRVGQRILAIGNPFGLERTLSDGIVSSLNRQLQSRNRRTMTSIIQIDAALNQGNSGGPLLNTQGELVGMNTAIATSTGDNAGIGFAVPVSTIRRVVPQLLANGRVTRPTIGIERVYETRDGRLVVVQVTPNGPADQAGIRGFRRVIRQGNYTFETSDPRNADIILEVDSTPVSTADDLLTIIERKKPGESVELLILRRNESQKVNVVLGNAQ